MSPSTSPIKPKTVRINVYLTENEKQILSDRAGTLSLSEYLRRAGLGKRSLPPPAPEINRLTYLLLADIGKSIQHLAIAASQSPQPTLDLTYLETLQQQIDKVRWQLLAPEAEGP